MAEEAQGRGRARVASGDAATDFTTELGAYVRRRLSFWSLIVTILAVALLLVLAVIYQFESRDATHAEERSSNVFHVVAILVLIAIHVWIRKRAPADMRVLRVVDAGFQVLTIGSCIAIYALRYDEGAVMMSAAVTLFLVGRALVVPSTVPWTVLLSVPAPIAYLAVQLVHGDVYAWPAGDGGAFPDKYVPAHLLLDQSVLWMGVLLAAVASRLNFDLRLTAFKAGRLNQYQLQERIGGGAMGEVFRAQHAMLRRPTAIKVIRRELTSRRVLQRFEREVRLTSLLTHPNTIRVYDFGATGDGVFFYAMELLDGADLGRVVDATGPLCVGRTIHVLTHTCGALREAHAMGLVHRDVKPGNILLCRQGLEHDVVKVMDFGLVKDLQGGWREITEMGEICGSPLTIAPETVMGEETTPAVDVYALGATGYYLLSGKAIFDARAAMEFAVKHVNEAPVPLVERVPDVPRDVADVIHACLEKAPGDRPASVREVARALRSCADAGTWSRDRATAWWEAHGDVVAAYVDPDEVSTAPR